MAEHNPQHGRRQHFHRGRRGPDRRGGDRRTPPQAQAPEGGRDSARDTSGVDVEQVMREIRSRIAQRHGIELTNQQIQELAARRLEAILEPRNVKPQLLEQLRKSAGTAPELPESEPIETYTFEDTTLYETHRGMLRFFRKLLHPILKLFFNPTPLINALNTQARINKALTVREAERERRQNEWNALQYELVQRMVTEAARLSIEMQALSARIESLGAKVDFNERRVRGMETVSPPAPARQQPRPQESRNQETRQPEPRPQEAPAALAAATVDGTTPPSAATGDQSAEGTRRRRRRRRGRRSGGGPGEAPSATGPAPGELDDADTADTGEDDDDEPRETVPVTSAAAGPQPTEDAPRPEAFTAAEPGPETAGAQPPASAPVVPTPPPDEPTPSHPVDHADPGPEDH